MRLTILGNYALRGQSMIPLSLIPFRINSALLDFIFFSFFFLLFLYLLKTSENLQFSDVFRWYRSGTLVKDGLIQFTYVPFSLC